MAKTISESNRKKVANTLAAITVICIVWILFYQDLIFPWGKPHKLLSSDYSLQFYPWLNYAMQSLIHGEIPWWCNLAGCGEPFVGKLETAPFYPLRIVLIPFIKNGRIPFHIAQLYQIGGILISAIGVYFLLRQLWCNKISSTFGGCLWVSSWDLAYHIAYTSFSEELITFPYILIFYIKALRENSYRNLSIAGLITGISLLAGNPQWTQLHIMLVLFFAITMNYKTVKQLQSISSFAKLIWPLAYIIIIAILVSSITLIPSWELFEHSPRLHSGIKFASSDSFTFRHILYRLLMDNPFGQGYLFLLLAAMAPFLVRNKLVYLFSTLALVFFDLTRGNGSYVYNLFYYIIPGFGMFRFPGRIFHLGVFSLIILASFTVNKLWEGGKRPLWICLSGAFLLSLLIFVSGEAPKQFEITFLLQITAISFCLFIWRRDIIRKSAVVLILIYAIIYPAFFPLHDDKWVEQDVDFYKVTPQVNYLKSHINHNFYRVTNIGALITHKNGKAYWNYHKHSFRGGLVWGIPTWSSNAELHVADLDIYAAHTRYPRTFDLLGIKYLVLGFDKPVDRKGKYTKFTINPGQRYQFELLAKEKKKDIQLINITSVGGPLDVEILRDDKIIKTKLIEGTQTIKLPTTGRLLELRGINGRQIEVVSIKYQGEELLGGKPRWREVFPGIYQNAYVIPKGTVVHHYSVQSNRKNVLNELNGLEPGLSVILEEEPNFTLVNGNTLSSIDQVVVAKYKPHYIEIKCKLKENGILVINDTYYPGWKVKIDNVQARLLRANYLFKAVALPPGTHNIKFIYDPWWHPWILILPLLGILFAIIVPLILHKYDVKKLSLVIEK